MTVTLELTPEMGIALTEEAERQGLTPNGFTEQAVMRELIANLKNQSIPQSLDEIKPRLQPPPGKTALDMIVGQWESEETDEELQAALKAMG